MENFKHCLLIDDDIDDQDIFKWCVKEIGANITCSTVDSGVDALFMLSNQTSYLPDYMFIDMNMSKMNGIECLRKIKEITRLNNSKVFMYSTTAEPRSVKESQELGANDFIVKPAKVSELKITLSKIFGIGQEAIGYQ
ncbi:MAG: response regulator [Bacteroidia bacterium]|nr:response regulator [Bacteroidia bacterium]